MSWLLSPRQLLQIPFIASLTGSPFSSDIVLTTDPSCTRSELSCPAKLPPSFDECCLEAPSGHFLSTQFWDTSPPLGANDSWTLHGLWPDHCNGGFDQYCDNTRSKSQEEIEAILEAASTSTHPDLLKFMSQHWFSFDSRNSHLWTHEWNKHGTCISTLKPKCYGDGADVVRSSRLDRDILDYFQQTTTLYSSLNTFKALQAKGIEPSYDVTYKLEDIVTALESSAHGQGVTVKCNSHHELQEVWYHFLVRGSLRDADPSSPDPSSTFVPTEADGQRSNCPAEGVKYLPKRAGSSPRPPPDHPPGADPTPFVGKGQLKVHVLPQENQQRAVSVIDRAQSQDYFQGCLIRPGMWYTYGTCAAYTAKTDVKHRSAAVIGDKRVEEHLFTLQSSFAPCAVLETSDRNGEANQFICARNLPVQSIFSIGNSSFITSDNHSVPVLSYKGQTVFYASKVPGRFEKISLFTDSGEGSREVQVEIHWEST